MARVAPGEEREPRVLGEGPRDGRDVPEPVVVEPVPQRLVEDGEDETEKEPERKEPLAPGHRS